MVRHDILVQGVGMDGATQTPPVILQMHDDDFPARFLTDLAASGQSPISSTISVDQLQPPQCPPVLFQPVQRMVHLAMVELNCQSVGSPRVDPKRVLSAGLVIRKVNVKTSGCGPTATTNSVSAWMRLPNGQYRWVPLTPQQQCLDPDPTKRPQLYSGQAELDRQLAAITLATANAEAFTPAFVAQPSICAALGRTVAYALIPTASSEVSDASSPSAPNPAPPTYDTTALVSTLPALLKRGSHHLAPLSGTTVDYRWMSDDFLQQQYPNDKASVTQFQNFSTALRMLSSAFGAFDGSQGGQAVLTLLNNYNVYNVTINNPSSSPPASSFSSMGMGDFYEAANTALLAYSGYPNAADPPPAPTTITMPTAWDPFKQQDQDDLVNALVAALGPRAQQTLTPQGRYQNRNCQYQLRLFFRIKGETSACPPELVWSAYSEPFRIAAWYESGDRPHPPVPLPDPTGDFMKNAKPNCSFHVPGALMGAMQGTTMSGLMSGGGGGPALSLDWICGFNIPLITICAFFVLNIFLSLLNIVFFWMAFIKICIPFPVSAGED